MVCPRDRVDGADRAHAPGGSGRVLFALSLVGELPYRGHMPAVEGAAEFYDELAEEYHLIFADWAAASDRQQLILTRLLAALGVAGGEGLDASCGIGTQALGLARAGFKVTATDISPASVLRCSREAASRDLHVSTHVADMREIAGAGDGRYEAAMSFDNALPHLLDDADLRAALSGLRSVLLPRGPLLASIRDYDAILLDRPPGDPPRSFTEGERERITFQAWDWLTENRYTVRHFILTRDGDGWAVTERKATYRALTRDEMSAALATVGFEQIVWQMPETTGFYQPIVTGRVPR